MYGTRTSAALNSNLERRSLEIIPPADASSISLNFDVAVMFSAWESFTACLAALHGRTLSREGSGLLVQMHCDFDATAGFFSAAQVKRRRLVKQAVAKRRQEERAKLQRRRAELQVRWCGALV